MQAWFSMGEPIPVGVGPVCWTPLPTGFSEWELRPRHAERSPIVYDPFNVIVEFGLLICVKNFCFHIH